MEEERDLRGERGVSRRRLRGALVVIVLVGAALRLVGLSDPVALRQGASWREADVGAIARSFHREGMNPLRPRIAWRADGPGYVESELPIVPWTIAAVWHVTGESPLSARLVVAAFGVAALLVFAGLAWRLLAPIGALAATVVFALNPLLAFLGTSLQPDPAMLLFSLLAFGALARWAVERRERALLPAAAWLALAILAKAPAAHLGVVFAVAILARRGLRAFRDGRVWLAGAIALAPAVAWYLWAHQAWETWGNSLGLSNEYHWFGLDVLGRPELFRGLLHRQVVDVFSFAGLALAGVAVLRRPWPTGVRLVALWYGAGLAFLVATIRTTGAAWAFYYHALTIAPAALLVGRGFALLAAFRPAPGLWRFLRWCGLLTAIVGGVTVLATDDLPRLLASGLTAVAVLGALFSYAVRPAAPACAAPTAAGARWRRTLAAAALPFLLAAAAVHLGALAIEHVSTQDPDRTLARSRACAQQLARHVPADALIVGTGGRHVGPQGRPVAYDRSMVFYFADRHDFTFPSDTEDLPQTLASLEERGGRYWFVTNGYLREHAPLVRDIVRRDALVDACDTHALVDLTRAFSEPRRASAPRVSTPRASLVVR